MPITAISFYWRNDTPSFVTWRSGLAIAPDTPRCRVIHGGQFTGGVHPPNQFVPEIVSPLPCSPALDRHTLLIVYFFKEHNIISFIGSLDKCHTSIFNALIFFYCRSYYRFLSHLKVKYRQSLAPGIEQCRFKIRLLTVSAFCIPDLHRPGESNDNAEVKS